MQFFLCLAYKKIVRIHVSKLGQLFVFQLDRLQFVVQPELCSGIVFPVSGVTVIAHADKVLFKVHACRNPESDSN